MTESRRSSNPRHESDDETDNNTAMGVMDEGSLFDLEWNITSLPSPRQRTASPPQTTASPLSVPPLAPIAPMFKTPHPPSNESRNKSPISNHHNKEKSPAVDDEASGKVASRTNIPSVSDTVNTPPVRHRRQREASAGDADAANTTAGKSQIASTLPDSKRRRKSASTKGKDRAVDDEAAEAASRTNTPSVAETDEPPSQSTNKCQREASSDVADTANTTAAKSQIGSTSRASKRQKPLTSTKGKGPATAQKLTSQTDIPTIAAVQSQVKPTSHGGKKASPSVSAALVLPSTTGNPNVAGTATPKTTPPTSRKRKRTPTDTVAHADQAETAPPTTKRSKVSQFTDTDPDATENAAGESQVEPPSASSTRKPSTSTQATRKGKGKKPAVPHGKKKGKSQAVDNRDPEEVASPTNEEPSWVRDAVEPNSSTNAVTKDMTPQKVDEKTAMEIKMKEMAKKQHEKEKAAHQEKCEVFRFMEKHPEFVSEDRMQITFTENVIRDVNTYMEEAYRDSGDQGNDWRCGDFGCWGQLLEIFELTGKTMSWKCPSRSEWLQNQRGMEWLLYQVLVNAGIQAIEPLKKAQFDDKDEEGWWIKFKAVALATHIDWKAALGHTFVADPHTQKINLKTFLGDLMTELIRRLSEPGKDVDRIPDDELYNLP